MGVNKITTKEAAEIIGSSPQFVRVAMQQGILKIGCACRIGGSRRWTYNISPKMLGEYIGKDIEAEILAIRAREEKKVG